MKKFIIVSAVLLGGLIYFTAANAMEGPSELVSYNNAGVSDDYEFIGNFYFCKLSGNSCYTYSRKVYQKGRNYYVLQQDQYYRLFPCNENGYNYYYADKDGKWYTNI